jgi:membrane-associated phospholipid phosphatase
MNVRSRNLAERLVAGYNGLMALIWLGSLQRAPHAQGLLLAHTAALFLPALFRRCRGTGGFTRLLHEIYPLILLAGFWTELDVLHATHGAPSSPMVPALDLAVFGVHLHEKWLPAMNGLWLSEPMYLMYFLYYPLIYVPLIAMAVRGRQDAVRDMTLRLMATFLACYTVYALFPVNGPQLLLTPPEGPYQHGVFYRLVMMAQQSGSALGCAFPSSHVAGAVTIAVLGWRWFPRWVAWLLTIEAGGVFLATTYTQNHYAVDSIAGLLLALALQFGVVPALQERRRSRAPVMALPVAPVSGSSPVSVGGAG